MADRSLHCILDVYGSRDLDLDPMTFICELDLYCLIYRMCKYELLTSRLESYRLTDIHTDKHTYRQNRPKL